MLNLRRARAFPIPPAESTSGGGSRDGGVGSRSNPAEAEARERADNTEALPEVTGNVST